MQKLLVFKSSTKFLLACVTFLASSCALPEEGQFYQGITVSPSYSYHLSGRTNRVKGYIVKIDNIVRLKNPGLVLLAEGLDKDGAYVNVNENRYDIPPIVGGLLGKIVIPVDVEHLKDGINEIVYLKNLNDDGYEVLDCRIESVKQNSTRVVGQTYRILAR